MTRYRVAKETPQLASMYLYSLVSMESAICDALCSHLETATNRQDMHFLVAVGMAALRVAFEIWLEQEANGDIVALVRENLEHLSSLT